eukprot:COSAG05_NODE_660_length_8054_cov_3.180264_8_plen_222_part_00
MNVPTPPQYPAEGAPYSGNIRHATPLGRNCLYLGIDLGRAVGLSPTTASVVLAHASFRANVPWCVADSVTQAEVPVDVYVCVSFVPSLARPLPTLLQPGEHPPLLPAAVENHPVWPDAWKSSTIDKQAAEKAAADTETSITGNESSKNRWVSEVPVDQRTRLSSVAAGLIATRALSAAAREQAQLANARAEQERANARAELQSAHAQVGIDAPKPCFSAIL